MQRSNFKELKTRIEAVIQEITPDMINNEWCDIEYHLDILLVTKSGHLTMF